MAFSALNNAWTAWYLENRPGQGNSPNTGTAGTALVSDLQANDFLCGMRAKVASTGSTTSGNRTLTLDRLGFQWTQTLVAASTVLIIRP
jgi:hypothetical protein